LQKDLHLAKCYTREKNAQITGGIGHPAPP